MRRRRIDGFDGRPAAGERQIVDARHDQPHRREGGQRRPERGHPLEPCHVCVIIRRKLSAVVIVRREMLVNRRLRVVGVGVVKMLGRQRRREDEARHQRKPGDRGAKWSQHRGDYGPTIGQASNGLSGCRLAA